MRVQFVERLTTDAARAAVLEDHDGPFTRLGNGFVERSGIRQRFEFRHRVAQIVPTRTLESAEPLPLNRRLMRPRVKAGFLEMLPDLLEDFRGRCGKWQPGLVDQAVDVVRTKTDAFHMKRLDGARQRFALCDECVAGLTGRLLLYDADELLDVRNGGGAGIAGHNNSLENLLNFE